MEQINSDNIKISAIDDVPLKKIGNFIKEARISRSQSQQELASLLKISEQQLKAIEDGRDDLLPEKVFVKAMVRKISEKLKLDTNYIMSEFKNQTKEIKVEEIVEKEEVKDVNKKYSITYGFIINIVIAGLIGFISSSFIVNLFIDLKDGSNNRSFIGNPK